MIESRTGLIIESNAEVLACSASLITTINTGPSRLLSAHYPKTQQSYISCCKDQLVELGHAVILTINEDETQNRNTRYLANLVVQNSVDKQVSTEAVSQALHELGSFVFENKIKSIAISSPINNKQHDIKGLLEIIFEKMPHVKVFLYPSLI